MILSIDELVRQLDAHSMGNDTKARDALWIRFGEARTRKTVEYSTADNNQRLHVYLDENDALVSLEIFS